MLTHGGSGKENVEEVDLALPLVLLTPDLAEPPLDRMTGWGAATQASFPLLSFTQGQTSIAV